MRKRQSSKPAGALSSIETGLWLDGGFASPTGSQEVLSSGRCIQTRQNGVLHEPLRQTCHIGSQLHGGDQPCIAGFRQEQHRCVLFDEAAPDMVLTNRKLFQCPNALVQMAQSKTGCHSYAVYLNDTLLVISSNHWGEALSRLPHSEAAWIEANQVLIRVTRPLWLPKGGKAASSS